MPLRKLQALADIQNEAVVPSMPEPERVVGLGFRYWMLGLNTGNIRCWEKAWSLYSGLFGAASARVAVGELASWVGALNTASCRNIAVLPETCPSFCRDECIAIAMIAACQHHTCPAMRACAFALIESSMIDGVVCKAQTFADTLAALEHRLSSGSIVAAPLPSGDQVMLH
ncbi:MAG TPA: hypothetical protein VNK52_07610 [Hyphomicrobiaceae bacterium]|nr:hypothetical protein [Hyphomicrobiaceae bacterium]